MIEYVYYSSGKKPIVDDNRKLKNIGGPVYDTYLVFENKETLIDSEDVYTLKSDQVLAILSEKLKEIGFVVEEDGKSIDLRYEVSGGRTKSFQPDAHNSQEKIAIEIESGQAKSNYKFLKDFFEAVILKEVDYMIIAVRRSYRTYDKKTRKYVYKKDYNSIKDYLDGYDIAVNHKWPIKGLMLIGY